MKKPKPQNWTDGPIVGMAGPQLPAQNEKKAAGRNTRV
jgi:hypothetical protein